MAFNFNFNFKGGTVVFSSFYILLYLCTIAVSFPQHSVLFADFSEPKTIAVGSPEDGKTFFSASEPDNNNVVPEDEKVSYSGAQLWQVVLDTDEKKILIGRLRDEKSKYYLFLFILSN